MHTLESFYHGGGALLETVHAFVHSTGLANISKADHICYKCGSREEYEHMRALLEPESLFVYQSYISKRRIAIVQLKKPFGSELGLVSVLELSDQKPDNSQVSSFDHMEVYPIGLSYDELIESLTNKGMAIQKIERPHHTTHDIELGNGQTLKLTSEPLLQKIKRDEMHI